MDVARSADTASDADEAFDAIVVGGGLIGLAAAWRAAERGVRVAVADPDPGSGASRVAAGMLAPVTEAHYGEEPLLRLGLESARRYPGFIADLERAAGIPAGYRACGTLAVAFDRDDLAALDELAAYHRRLGLESARLTGRECRELEPLLTPAVGGGLLVAGDHQVDNRMLTAALLKALSNAGVPLYRDRVVGITVEGGRVAGARLGAGRALRAGLVVLAAGCHGGDIAGLPPGAVPAVRPVKGQILRLTVPAAQAPFLSRIVRGTVRGRPVYLVPRDHGELVVGATAEELGFDTQVTAGGVYGLLRDAHHLVPGVGELPLAQASAGLRPASADNAPLLGPVGPDGPRGLILATGHYRNGVLLTPVTADVIAELLATGNLPPIAHGFRPTRFDRAPRATAAAAGVGPDRTASR
jgi:glycine oxidase